MLVQEKKKLKIMVLFFPRGYISHVCVTAGWDLNVFGRVKQTNRGLIVLVLVKLHQLKRPAQVFSVLLPNFCPSRMFFLCFY